MIRLLLLVSVLAHAAIRVEYPPNRAVFPPDMAAPTFIWQDDSSATRWRIEMGALAVEGVGEPLRVGEIDERAVAETNERPRLTPEQERSRTWRPDAAAWAEIRKRPEPAITIVGLDAAGKAVSRATVTLRIAKDPVGAPIFFRDVPLMPAQLEKGVIKPLPKSALPLVAWRLRYVNEDRSRLLIDNLPVCMNCHSFSRDGKTMGLDLDGPANDKGLYALAPIEQVTTIRQENVVAWSSFRGKLGSKIRVGFMSQVSPGGQYVVTMVSPSDLGRDPSPGGNPLPADVQGNYYVANFKDYRFLQVFYPTRGILAWYSRESGKLQPLPGADDPRYVHTNAVWSPDGQHLVFARAEARSPYPAGGKMAERANDPEETPVRYDLYRIPFNGGRGGVAEPVAGASANGMSNSFPKISPDGKWLVFTGARNGLLMRPDSKLFIVPAAGGKARAMNCNTPLMNSWHSFSPNGRWLVFSSKSRSPYTQMFLTHLDEDGQDSPPVLIENATAANRAVNIPEFVNIGPDAWAKIEAPATEFYRIADAALELLERGEAESAAAEFRRALQMEPEDATALSNLGAALAAAGQTDEALGYFRRALALDPDNWKTQGNVGAAFARLGDFESAAGPLAKAVELNPEDARSQSAYGGVLAAQGRLDDAMVHLQKALQVNPSDSDAHNNLGGILARQGKFAEAIPHFEQAVKADPKAWVSLVNLGRALAAAGRIEEGARRLEQAKDLTNASEPVVLDKLAAVYAQAGRYDAAVAAAQRALDLAALAANVPLLEEIKERLTEYRKLSAGQ